MIDRRFLDVSLIVQGVANEPAENPTIGTQYIVDEMPTGDFENAEPGQIARYDGENWSFITPKDGDLEVINAESGELMRFDGTEWKTKVTFSNQTLSSSVITETHILTQDEVWEKSFNLKNEIMSGKESEVILSVCGVVQIFGVDYTASGHTIKWNGYDNSTYRYIHRLRYRSLKAGDTFIIQYTKE